MMNSLISTWLVETGLVKTVPKRELFLSVEVKPNFMKFRIPKNRATEFVRETAHGFSTDKVLKLAAALAYSTLFALPALLIIILWICSVFYSPSRMEANVTLQMNALIGAEAADQVREILINTKFDYTSLWAKVLGVIVLAVSATGVFGEIQDSINTIWGLETKPRAGILKIFINRLLSFSLILSLGFILVVSLIANAVISGLSDNIRVHFPWIPVQTYYILNQGVMAFILILLFGTIFKVLPDAKLHWRDIVFSATITTALFMAGKYVIEYILGHNTTISMYGSAGAVIVILLWVYYSSIILYLGAEMTQVWIKLKGRKIQPNKYAVWVEKRNIQVESNTDIEKRNEPTKENKNKVA
jgi:membrane protein